MVSSDRSMSLNVVEMAVNLSAVGLPIRLHSDSLFLEIDIYRSPH